MRLNPENVNDKKTMCFQLRISNMITSLKLFKQQRLISYSDYFDLWIRLLEIKTHEELNKFVEEVRGLIDKKKIGKEGSD